MSRNTFQRVRPYVAGVVLAVAAAASFTAVAHGGPRHAGHEPSVSLLAESPEHLDRSVNRMLRNVDATDEQRDRIRAIAKAAADDLKGQHQATRELRERMATLLGQSVVDANAIEAARQDLLKQQDATSRRISQALIDAANVLNPEQRQKLLERFSERAGKGDRRHEERRHPEQSPRS